MGDIEDMQMDGEQEEEVEESTSLEIDEAKVHEKPRHHQPLLTSMMRLQIIVCFWLSVWLLIICFATVVFTREWGIVAIAAALDYGAWLAVPPVVELDEKYGLGKRYRAFRLARKNGAALSASVSGAIGTINPDDPYQSGINERIAAPASSLPSLVRQSERRIQIGMVERLTVDEIVLMNEPNSFQIVVGRSLTQPGNPPITMKFYKKHLKFIGASQKGKSSMAAALLDIITRTHDTSRVLVALLDLEDQTSNLFKHVPNLAQYNVNGRSIPLHARNEHQCLEYLGYIIDILTVRYEMTKREIMNHPILLVYIEEFLRLKNYFKARMESAPKEKKDLYKADYVRFVDAISLIASRGLKARVQLMLCAQVNYRDDDLQESLINVDQGFCFSVLPTAANAAGFYDTELVTKCARESVPGQAVMQTTDCNDYILAPEYDLEARLVAMEEAELEEELRRDPYKVRSVTTSSILTPVGTCTRHEAEGSSVAPTGCATR